ncbi:MAG: DUF2442 domain-containing protein [Clostridia bacterium]|nr:DUF2442 domain-containing protein [Clostridia bacterium]MBQ6427124.1 DUF2442 domain-containing protein [Clostridia bacterium]
MKLFAIKSDSTGDKVLGYLLYYEKTGQFYIELPGDTDEWETPLLLSSFIKRGQRTVNSYWSRVWVQQRIVPPDRQNISAILKENGLERYDEFALLTLAEGRCAQDDFYIEPSEETNLPREIRDRFSIRVEEAVPLADGQLLVFFRNGEARRCDMKKLCGGRRFVPILQSGELFSALQIQTDGYGITWGENLDVDAGRLYREGADVPLSIRDFRSYAAHCVTDTAGACKLLKCSRQNISDLVKRGKLHPIHASAAGALFLLSELRERLWQ